MKQDDHTLCCKGDHVEYIEAKCRRLGLTPHVFTATLSGELVSLIRFETAEECQKYLDRKDAIITLTPPQSAAYTLH
jgi:hypothetical protein